MDLPLGLRSALETGSCVLFLGAGVGAHCHTQNGLAAPDGVQLATELATEFDIELGSEEPELAKIAEIVIVRKGGRRELDAFLTQRLADLEPDEDFLWLLSRTWRAIFTTNYDRCIQRAYEMIKDPTQQPVTFSSSADVIDFDPRFQVPIYHLHGSLFEGREPFALISQSDYARFKERRRMLFEILKTKYATNPILYVGYSHRDPNWLEVFEELREEYSPSTPPESYRVTPTTPAIDREILESQRVHTIDGGLRDFQQAVSEALGDIRVEPHKLSQLESQVPEGLRQAFEQNPAAIVRLLNAWEYANEADFASPPNTEAFLKGDHANWSLVAQGKHFERDVEALVLDECIDFFTSPKPGPRVVRLLAPAGYGVSTALMSVATSLFYEN
jgi:hypothetical protein